MTNSRRIVPLAIAFEAGLGLAGWRVARWFDVPIERQVVFSAGATLRAGVALVPMLLLLVMFTRTTWRPLADLRRHVGAMVRQMFAGATLLDLALLSLAAGFGEELLFRGAIQPLAIRWTTPAAGIAAASLLFGALHAASRTYFILATVIGAYLGWLAHAYDDLTAPILAHAAYDFAALAVLLRVERSADL